MKRIAVSLLFLFITTALMLGVVYISTSELAPGEMAGHWAWFAKTSLLFATSVFIGLILHPKGRSISHSFYLMVSWILILFAGVEAVLGLRQLHGFASSNHSLFALTGSFFNPGPYSGYLAMIFPLCLNEWLKLKDKKEKSWIEIGGTYLSAGVMLLILCVLPSGMSRSAWLAAAVSGLWVCGMHYNWGYELKRMWTLYRKWVIGLTTASFVCLLLGAMLVFHT